MKNKDLIEKLQKLDPEATVVIGGGCIHFAWELPGYFDGHYEELILDKSKEPFYSVKGLRFRDDGTKIVLNQLSLEDIIWNCESLQDLNELEFTFNKTMSLEKINYLKNKIESIKREVIKEKGLL